MKNIIIAFVLTVVSNVAMATPYVAEYKNWIVVKGGPLTTASTTSVGDKQVMLVHYRSTEQNKTGYFIALGETDCQDIKSGSVGHYFLNGISFKANMNCSDKDTLFIEPAEASFTRMMVGMLLASNSVTFGWKGHPSAYTFSAMGYTAAAGDLMAD